MRKPFSDAELATCLDAVAERANTEEELSERLPGMEAVSRDLSHGVVVSDLAGNVVYLNPKAEEITGWRSQDACRTTLGDVVRFADSTDGNLGSDVEDERRDLTKKSGELISITEKSSAIKAKDGEALGLLTLLYPAEGPSTIEFPRGEESPDEQSNGLPTDLPPARSDALRKIAELAKSSAYREAIRSGSGEAPTGTPPSLPTQVDETKATTEEENSTPQSPEDSSHPLIDEVADPILKLDEDGKILYANGEAKRLFGESGALEQKPFTDLFDQEDSERYTEHFTRPQIDGKRHRFEFHDSQRAKWYEMRLYPRRDGMVVLLHDITSSRLETSEQIRQQRLEGLGLLARGFAHDFNNHLTTLTGNISLAREKHQEDSELQSMLLEAQTAATRATGLVQQLMTFARGGRPIREKTKIADLIRKILTEQRIQQPEIRYQFQSPDTESIANVDPAQINRLIENLIANSAAAMNGGGVLIVRCAQIKPEEVIDLRESHTPSDEDHLLIEVIDTGHGMSEENLARVFDPYFTTRREDNATGIGLTVCESIAKAHGGFIQLQSKEGKGTIATFCAPLGRRPDSQDEAIIPDFEIPKLSPRAEKSSKEGNLLTGTRILILEDDAPIRRLMAATLRRAGHEVVETKDGRETVAIYQDALEKGDPFHLLICDLTIENGVGGVETMRRMLEIDPNVLAIVSSGYSDAPAMSSPASFGFRGVLPKPYAPSELRAVVHRILAAHHIIP